MHRVVFWFMLLFYSLVELTVLVINDTAGWERAYFVVSAFLFA